MSGLTHADENSIAVAVTNEFACPDPRSIANGVSNTDSVALVVIDALAQGNQLD